MKITLNGKKCEDYDGPLSVRDLLEALNLSGQPVLVELDGMALHGREFDGSMVEDGSTVELIRVAAGG